MIFVSIASDTSTKKNRQTKNITLSEAFIVVLVPFAFSVKVENCYAAGTAADCRPRNNGFLDLKVLLSTNVMLVCDLSDLLSVFCPDISVTVPQIGVKFCMMVHIGPDVVSPLGAVPRGSQKSQILGKNFGHLTANISKTCQSQRYMSIRATSA